MVNQSKNQFVKSNHFTDLSFIGQKASGFYDFGQPQERGMYARREEPYRRG